MDHKLARLLAGVAPLVTTLLAGCGSTPGVSSCVPGASQVCACVSGGSGAQVCGSDGTFGACSCAGIDAAITPDAGAISDGGSDAAAMPESDAGSDAATPAVDTGIDCPTPFVVCGGACIDPSTNPAHCGASGSCGGSSAGASCRGACLGGRCVWDACQDALAAGQTTDGTYLVDIDGDGPIAPADAYCDMTTAGGGWTLVYKIRNDLSAVASGWWGNVDAGDGDSLPTDAMPIAAGSGHFEGPTLDVRMTFYARVGAVAGHVESRGTLVDASGAVRIDVETTNSDVLRLITMGIDAQPTSSVSPGTPVRVIAAASGLPSAGTTLYEFYTSGCSGACGPTALVLSPTNPFGTPAEPLVGDTSVSDWDAASANSTTLIWIRGSHGAVP